MKDSHKKYILDHAGDKSAKDIARDLGVKERKVKRFLEEKAVNKPAGFSSKEKPFVKFGKPVIALAVMLIVILGAGVYLNSLHGKFVWDDYGLIQNNENIRDWGRLSNVFAGDMSTDRNFAGRIYRPLQVATYIFDNYMWGSGVIGYHATSILLHIGVALMLFWFMNVAFRDMITAFLTAVFFVVHPVHTEAVAYISGRADPLSVFFILLAFTVHVKNLDADRLVFKFIVAAAYLAALLSRESALVLPLLIAAYNFIWRKYAPYKGFLPVFMITVLYVAVRFFFLGFLFNIEAPQTTPLERLPGFLAAFADYLKLLVLPFHLHMEYGDRLFSLAEPKVLVGALLMVGGIAYAFAKRGDKRVYFSMLWFFIAFIPASNIYPVNAYMAEHWLYLPSMGFLMIFSIYFGRISLKRNILVSGVLFLALLCFYSFLTVRQNRVWRDPVVFLERTAKYAPDSLRVLNELAIAYADGGNNGKAIESFEKMLLKDPDNGKTYSNLAILYFREARYDLAIECSDKGDMLGFPATEDFRKKLDNYRK